MKIPLLRSWIKAHSDGATTAITAVALNFPLLALMLYRHLDGVSPLSMAGIYAALVFLGYYALIISLIISLVFLLTPFSRRIAAICSGALLTASLFYFFLNSVVLSVYKFQLDAFWISYAFTNLDGIGIQPEVLLAVAPVLLLIAVLEYKLFHVASSFRYRPILAFAFLVLATASLFASQAMHVVAYYREDSRITSLTPRLPLYYPLTSHRNAAKFAQIFPATHPFEQDDASASPASIRYPLGSPLLCLNSTYRSPNIVLIVLESWRSDMMDEEVSPNIHALAQKSVVCLKHYSSGNATPTGIFGLFYGIHPTYWTAVKANSSVIDNPVLIDILKARNYAFGIYADSHFERHKIKDTIFRGIEVHEEFAGGTPDAKDADMAERFLAFAEEQVKQHRPFMGFAFFKSTHYSYYYPEGFSRFRPSQKLNLALINKERDPQLYLNDYRNSILYDDALVGRIVAKLDSLGAMDNTVVIITSDHGEEFNDNKANYWGHTSNFTQYQTRVPMIMYIPWEAPRRINYVTCHADIPPTLLREALGCAADVRDYSNGRDLLGPLDAPRPIVIGGYVNYAFVVGDNVYAVFPMHVEKYKEFDIRTPAVSPPPDLVRQAMEETHRFLGSEEEKGVPRLARVVSGKS